MPFVELDIDKDNNRFLISGNISQITKNHRAKYFFLDVLNASFNDNKTISIPFNEDEKENLLQTIQDALSKYEIEQKDSARIRDVLKAFYNEKENFDSFSQKAKGIWNNQIDEKDFRKFKQSIEKHLVGRRLYDKQLLASFHLAFSQNACNFSVPGSGKTSIVYATFAYLKNLPSEHPKRVNKLLVIGPLSSFGPWEDEFFQCFNRKPNSIRLSGGMPKSERDRHLLSIQDIEQTPELTLMSYQSISYNLDSLIYYLQRSGNNVMVVLDEAHRIKNIEGGVWATAILSISKYCNSRVILTGTPLPNGYEDIYNLFEFIWPGKDIINFSVYQLKDMSNNRYDPRINQLIENISPFFVRIRKSHLNLPPAVSPDPTYVEMGAVQRQIYEFIENKYLSYFIGNERTLSLNPTDRAKSGVKRSVLCEGSGIPVGVVIDADNRQDVRLTEATLKSVPIERPAPSALRPQGLCLDKGYDSDEVRDLVSEFGYTAHIRARGEEAQALKRKAKFKARRWVVERTHSWMNRFRRILIRWEKKPMNYFALLHFVCAIITYRSMGLFG